MGERWTRLCLYAESREMRAVPRDSDRVKE